MYDSDVRKHCAGPGAARTRRTTGAVASLTMYCSQQRMTAFCMCIYIRIKLS